MTSELGRRSGVTPGALLVYRISSHVPLPGIGSSDGVRYIAADAGGIPGAANVSAGVVVVGRLADRPGYRRAGAERG